MDNRDIDKFMSNQNSLGKWAVENEMKINPVKLK